MNYLFILAAVATVASVQAAFSPGDTPEVALAKVAHFAEHAKEAARPRVLAPRPDVYRSVAYSPYDIPEIAAARIVLPGGEIVAGAGYPYADYYKSLSDYYTSTAARHAYAPGYISAARVIAPGGYFIP